MKKKGFTLIELLVVIAIIALLMAVLMPALSRVRKQAKNVACQMYLKQWAVVWQMYTGDHGGSFPTGQDMNAYKPGHPTGFPGAGGWWWMLPTRPYYQDHDIRICPTTKLDGRGPFRLGGGVEVLIDKLIREEPSVTRWKMSYGPNIWTSNPLLDAETVFMRQPVENCWRTTDVSGASEIPVFLDCTTMDAAPTHKDSPPSEEDDFIYSTHVDNMRPFCVNRHDAHTQGLLLDWSVRKIGLKELWELKWHRNWNPNMDPPPAWPEWMENFKDYARDSEEDEGEGPSRGQ